MKLRPIPRRLKPRPVGGTLLSLLLGCVGCSLPSIGAPVPMLTPSEQLATFRLPPGYRMELVVADPIIKEPVAIAFDGNGRLITRAAAKHSSRPRPPSLVHSEGRHWCGANTRQLHVIKHTGGALITRVLIPAVLIPNHQEM